MNRSCVSVSPKIATLLFALSPGAMLGCGGSDVRPHAAISGSVTVNGKTLENGRIVFRPLDAKLGNGGSAKIVDGDYQLKEVPLGTIVFTFSGFRLTGKTIRGPSGQPEPERANIIPQKILQEGVQREIGENGIQDFSLEGNP